MINKEEMTFDWSIRKIFMENEMVEMDSEIQLEFYKKEVTEERNIDTNVEQRNFCSRFWGESAVRFKWGIGP